MYAKTQLKLSINASVNITIHFCQIDTFICYYNEDYSLSEIALEFNVSRNAVWDTLKKVISLLEHYESKLKLYEKDVKLNEYLEKLKNHVDEEGLIIINDIEEME